MPSDFRRHLAEFQDLLPRFTVTGELPPNSEFVRIVVRNEATRQSVTVDDLTTQAFSDEQIRVRYARAIAEVIGVAPGG